MRVLAIRLKVRTWNVSYAKPIMVKSLSPCLSSFHIQFGTREVQRLKQVSETVCSMHGLGSSSIVKIAFDTAEIGRLNLGSLKFEYALNINKSMFKNSPKKTDAI